MILQNQFDIHKYHSLLIKEIANQYNLDIDFLMDDENQKPKELYDIYISDSGDEIFLTLNGDGKDLEKMCQEWDKKLGRFVIFGSDDKKTLRKFKYNIVLLILCTQENIDYKEEGSLNVSRKIILPCSVNDVGDIDIPDEEAVEIPFYMITSGDFSLDKEKQKELEQYMPSNKLEFLLKKQKAGRGKKSTFEDKEYKEIEEWLKNVHHGNED